MAKMIRLTQEVDANAMIHGFYKCGGCGKSITRYQSYYEVQVDQPLPVIVNEVLDLKVKKVSIKKVTEFYHEECVWAFEPAAEKIKSATCPKCFMVGHCFCEVK
jgi:hypothetical protein